MRKLCLLLFIFLSIQGISQTPDTSLSGRIKAKIIETDSSMARFQRFTDSVDRETRKKEAERMAEQSGNYFLQLQKERRAKEKRNAYIRIGIGVAFFVVLIIGLLRRRAKK
jgi:hypothetical protein